MEKSSLRCSCTAVGERSGKGTEDATGEIGDGGRWMSSREIIDDGVWYARCVAGSKIGDEETGGVAG